MDFSCGVKALWGVAGLATALLFFAVLKASALVGAESQMHRHGSSALVLGPGERTRSAQTNVFFLRRLQHAVDCFAV